MSISSDETVLEDVNLGFRYKLALVKTASVTSGTGPAVQGFPDTYQQFNPQNIPGIPPNIQRYPQPQQIPRQQPRPTPDKSDDDTDDTDN
jgi:hypothetical protein